MLRKISNLLLLVAVLFLRPASTWASISPPPVRSSWQDHVDAQVLTASGEREFLVFLGAQAELDGAAHLGTKLEKGKFVFQQLSTLASISQKPVLTELQALGAEYRPYWIANFIWVRGSLSVVQAMAQRSDVAHIYANPAVPVDLPTTARLADQSAPQAIEWNIQKVGAPQVWAAGFTGQGAVVGGQDTGYQWDHPALIGQYRGWGGTGADHNYSWHDAIHEDNPNTPAGNPCGFDSPFPCDDQGHGTHTMGTMVGDDGAGNQIGMAPGARWIGCRNMEQGWGTPVTYLECYQWFLAPTDLLGNSPDPSLAPDVINNSWVCPPAEGCTDPYVFELAANNLRVAGILNVQAAGNSGSGCGSIDTPPAIYDSSFTVGATDASDTIAVFSSRGPAANTGLMKPDVSAPGSGIRSSIPSGGYNTSSGTSMAAPHVAGMAALLISASPDLHGAVERIENLIRLSAVRRSNAQTCGGLAAGTIPNNIYGWGRIDAWAAFQAARSAHYLPFLRQD